MPNDKSQFQSAVMRYGLAVVASAIAILLRHAMTPLLPVGYQNVTVFAAIIVVAGLAGRGPAILTSILGSLLAAHYFTNGLDLGDLPGVITVILTGFLAGWLAQRLRDAVAKIEAQAKALAKGERRYRELFENMIDGFAHCRMLFDEDGRPVDFIYLDVNSAFGRLTGMGNVVGKKVTEIIPNISEEHPELLETYGRVARTGNPERFEFDFKPLAKWLSIAVYSPQADHFAAVFADITERKQAEEMLHKFNTELESKNKELETIIGIVSHDLRAPLVNVKGFAKEIGKDLSIVKETLQKETSCGEPLKKLAPVFDGFGDSINFITSSAEAVDNLATSLVDITRAGLAAIKPEMLDMNEVIAKVVSSIEFKFKERNILYDIDANLPPCFGDRQQVTQIFTNLLDNAAKYTDPNRPGQICVGGNIQAGHALYWISDNGIGISVEDQEKIFEPYYQLHEKAAEGAGIGLATVKRMVDRNSGRIWVVSEKGKGAIFCVALPASPARAG